MMLTALPYHVDSADLFEAIADEPWSVFLDSGRPRSTAGRIDILAARPSVTLVTRGDMTDIRRYDGMHPHARLSPDDPFDLLREALAADGEPTELPFAGGAIGYFGYDLGRRIERLPQLARATGTTPDMAVGIYDWALVVDHDRRASWLVGAGRDPRTAAGWDALVALFGRAAAGMDTPTRRPFRVGTATCNFTRAGYRQAFARVQRYIAAGDCYQVNLAQGFSAPASGDAWLGYQTLRRLNPAPYSAYLNVPDAHVLSSSPERFLEVRRGRVETKPIKGTRPRAAAPEADSALARELRDSLKDRAENLMIVDLLRNDLGKVCEAGSVAVPRLFEVESFATVHHLVSTITGRLPAATDAIALLRASFPGGSITGAPKLRAMQIIEELEPERRGAYCGAIGWLGFNGDMDSNIAIRTLTLARDTLRFSAGGGLVADSQVDAEYQECLDKAAALLRLVRECGGDLDTSLTEEQCSGS
ncbi:MAG: aminodeoxychorismate synthase, component I [Thiobacillus sp. 65-69]|nr:aminodeoxychorismate synthase component I [Thiobacillus sp.]ODU87559.1 MAG: aminodeoxychorismate synthase, component I [Thiobacillus sp. SCN 65-179]OJW38692.1 MAG: aminodeoxychorismate synthase, component I [Thiobacillus sp. 65-69]